MREVCVLGVGQTPVREHWESGLRELAVLALCEALEDAQVEAQNVTALYVGNMLSGQLSGQQHLGVLVADAMGLSGIEALRIEAACGSGAGAFRQGVLAIASGAHDFVAVVGVEKMTDVGPTTLTSALAGAADMRHEGEHGFSFVALNALLMRRYMHEYDVAREAFGAFALEAHRNGANNPHALFRTALQARDYEKSPEVATPLRVLDAAGVADGAAAVILCRADWARRLASDLVRVKASSMATDRLMLSQRPQPLFLTAAARSVAQVYDQAGVTPADIDLFELHDAFGIMAALSLEAAGFADRGFGVRLAQEGEIAREGRIPISTMGGLKARGHPVGASGMYQIVETCLQLRGQAGANQLPHPRLGMTQSIGGLGATVCTHILEGPNAL